MSDDKTKESFFTAWVKGGIVNKILLLFGALFIMIFVWSNMQNEKMLGELVKQNKNVEKLIQEQTKLKAFKKCIKDAHDDASMEFNKKLLMILGETLSDNNVAFPQELNESIVQFREKFNIIKDCLIFPEDLN